MLDRNVELTSLCMVTEKDYNGQRWLLRLADVSNGNIVPYIFDEEAPRYFDNRNRLYWRDGPDESGIVGVWDWSAIPNRTDYEKDFIETFFAPDKEPIEIIEVSAARTLEELISYLQHGIAVATVTRTTLFSCLFSRDSYIGILCTSKDVTVNGKKVVLKNDVIALPQYNFYVQDIFHAKEKMFYRKLELGPPQRRVVVKAPSEVVKEAFIRRSSWAAMKLRGMSKNEWRQFKDFLNEITDDSLYQEIANYCECSEKDAKEYVDSFVTNANRYIDREDIDSQVLESVVENHAELRQRCEDIVAGTWENVHKEQIDAAKTELQTIQFAVEEQKAFLESAKSEVETTQKIIAELDEEIIQYETLGKDVEEKVNQRIAAARKNAADFIGEMAFQSPVQNPAALNTGDYLQDIMAFYVGKELDGESVPLATWKEFIDTLEDELYEAGVAEGCIPDLAAYLYAVYINRAPLLLVGPCGASIADAFATAMYGKTAGILDCAYPFSPSEIQRMLQSEDSIIIIKSPFRAGWIEPVIDLLLPQKKQYMLVTPFAEDLLIEPKGIYNYAVPILTETIVDRIPTNNFVGGKIDVMFKHYEPEKGKLTSEKFLKIMNMSRLSFGRLQDIVRDYHAISNKENKDMEYLLGMLPYAYLAEKTDILVERIREVQELSKEMQVYILGFLGENG